MQAYAAQDKPFNDFMTAPLYGPEQQCVPNAMKPFSGQEMKR
jgi:hypothetical protein